MRYLFPLLSIAIILIAPFLGQIPIEISQINIPNSMEHTIFWKIRLPRIVVAFFTGALLGLSGLLFQSLFRNPMSTPFTLGVASGATLGTAFAIVFGLTSMVALFGFLGAMMTVITLFSITSRLSGYETNSLLLVGIALSFFYSASLMVLFYLSDESQSYEIIRFTMGSLDVVGFGDTFPLILSSILLLLLAIYYKDAIRLLLTSYDNAFLKGIEVKRVNTVLLIAVSIAVGIAVSLTGPIGFVGLIIPHIIKNIYQQSADRLLIPTFFYSGVFLVLCDLIARNLGTSSDIPIGVITSFLGGPFFVYLLIRQKT
ncbi:MAG TPA: iron ABC transporter permease [Campylobacterales bacterium]|nr:iron ABC transporter permease [Campylobacterales bacterium]HIP41425.1 iron ABC transporter permease [Campylobacterales bacterium]